MINIIKFQKEHLKTAEQFFKMVGESAAECGKRFFFAYLINNYFTYYAIFFLKWERKQWKKSLFFEKR